MSDSTASAGGLSTVSGTGKRPSEKVPARRNVFSDGLFGLAGAVSA
ncbi:hypothetical protein [Neisseria elongata]|nr:hypothetical protein [Neisseria elongata]